MRMTSCYYLAAAFVLQACTSVCADARPQLAHQSSSQQSATGSSIEEFIPESSEYRGWDYLVGRLRALGIDQKALVSIYQNPQMPLFSFIPFRVRPMESVQMYSGFKTREKVQSGREFLARHAGAFARASKQYRVRPSAVAAILLVETHFGANTGQETIVYRLSRVASVAEPNNMRMNYEKLKKETPEVTFEQVQARAAFLEQTFAPELKALATIARLNKIDPFHIKGSPAGAFGLPQFLPSSYLRFGIDGNRDGHISLFNETDAIFSTANYLAQHGWKDSGTHEEHRQVIWHYNHSDPYVETVLWLSNAMDSRDFETSKR